jgi:hypothetical protein
MLYTVNVAMLMTRLAAPHKTEKSTLTVVCVFELSTFSCDFFSLFFSFFFCQTRKKEMEKFSAWRDKATGVHPFLPPSDRSSILSTRTHPCSMFTFKKRCFL